MEPNLPSSRLTQTEESTKQVAAQQTAQAQTGIEFATVEDMLRHDAARTDPPATLQERLQQAIAQNPPAPRSWWWRLRDRMRLGGS